MVAKMRDCIVKLMMAQVNEDGKISLLNAVYATHTLRKIETRVLYAKYGNRWNTPISKMTGR